MNQVLLKVHPNLKGVFLLLLLCCLGLRLWGSGKQLETIAIESNAASIKLNWPENKKYNIYKQQQTARPFDLLDLGSGNYRFITRRLRDSQRLSDGTK